MGFLDLKDIEKKSLFPKTEVRFIHTEKMTIAYWNLEEGAEILEHAHPHEQVSNVLEGEMELKMNGETKFLGPGQVAVFPSNVAHSGRAKSRSRVIDVFCPVREDYK